MWGIDRRCRGTRLKSKRLILGYQMTAQIAGDLRSFVSERLGMLRDDELAVLYRAVLALQALSRQLNSATAQASHQDLEQARFNSV